MELTIELTNACKNKCIHCSSSAISDARLSKTLPTTTVLEIVHDLKPKKVILSGGEPFLHPDLETIISGVKKLCPVLAINTSAIFDVTNIPANIHLVDEFYVSIFCYDNEKITMNPGWMITGKPLFFATILKMHSNARTWFNVVIFSDDQANDIASISYHLEIPVHVIKLIARGRGTRVESLPIERQRWIARSIIDQLDPSRIDDRIPPFLRDEGYGDIEFSAIRDEASKKMKWLHPRCKISHSLLDGACRAREKRTLLPDGRVIGCVAGKGVDERFDIIKACNK